MSTRQNIELAKKIPTCAICRDDILKSTLTTSCCNQTYHNKCYRKWMQDNPTCPTCRQPCAKLLKPNSSAEFCYKILLMLEEIQPHNARQKLPDLLHALCSPYAKTVLRCSSALRDNIREKFQDESIKDESAPVRRAVTKAYRFLYGERLLL